MRITSSLYVPVVIDLSRLTATLVTPSHAHFAKRKLDLRAKCR